jgi:hypothetical protein
MFDIRQRLARAPHPVTSENRAAKDAVRAYLGTRGWQYEEIDASLLRTHFNGRNGSWRVYVSCIDSLVVVYSILDEQIPAERRSAVSELFSRANFTISVGNFDLDFGSGEVRYRTSVEVGETGESATPLLIGHLVELNVSTVDRHYPALLAVARGQRAPIDALELVGGPSAP